MNDWEKVKLGDCVSILGDGLHGTPKYNNNGEYYFINGNNLINGNIVLKEDTKRVSFDEFEKYKKLLNNRTILVSINGTIGNVAKYKEEKCILGKSACYFNIKDDIDKDFIYYIIVNSTFQSYIKQYATGTTIKNVSLKQMKDFEFSLPPLETQEKIAAILGCLDDKIEINNKINANLENQAQTIFKHYFVDNPQKENWKKGKAMDFYDITIGKTPPRKETKWFSKNINDIVWISISDMGQSGIYINSSSEYLTKEAVENFNIVLVPINTILLSFKLTIGRVSIANCNLTTNEAIAHFKISNNNLLEYTYFILKNYDYSKLGNTSSIGNAVNSKTIKTMPWIIPDENVLNKFHFITEKLFNKIKINQKENTIVAEIRNMLLPKLMNGEIDV